MEEYSYELKIPKDRIAVLIGPKGKVKRQIEDLTEVNLDIDSKEGDVTIYGKDSIKLYTVREVVKAIGRGFNPEVSLQLLKTDFTFEMFNMNDFAKTKNQLLRLKGRIIGKEGKARSNLEHLTETNICVYGKTIGIVGRVENVSVARRAIETLLEGSPHSSVWKWLEKKRREMKQAEFEMKNNGTEDII